MNARVLFILLALCLLLSLLPRLRKGALLLSGVLLLALFWSLLHLNAPHAPHAPHAPQPIGMRSASSAAVQKRIELTMLQLQGDGAPWRLTGRVQNLDTSSLRSLTLNIERFDCSAASAPWAECTLLWQDAHTVIVTIAPQQSAKLDERFYSHESIARVQGVVRDRFTLISVE